MTNIKVTVEYEVPKTNKFDALLAEYALAKKIADETESYYKPLADAAEEAKFDAIMGQLESIKYYAKQISQLKGDEYSVWIKASIPASERGDNYPMYNSGDFTVVYSPKESEPFKITWEDCRFTKEFLKKARCNFCEGKHNIIGNWDKWKVYNILEESAIRQLQMQIDKQKARQKEQISRLNNIKGDM
jgi:hypothetical protein